MIQLACRTQLLFGLYALLSVVPTHSIVMHELLTEKFQAAAVPTEFQAYSLLKEHPLSLPVNYVAIPWYGAGKKLQDEMPSLKLDGAFTICQSIFYRRLLPIMKKIGIDTLFTPHASNLKKWEGITIAPFPHMPINGTEPAVKKNILYSFVGARTNRIRKKIFKMHHPKNAVVIRRKYWHFARDEYKPNVISKEEQKRQKESYQDVLARSRFSLCPKGSGAGSIRIWESLQAGAIPVIISDELRLPPGVEWDKTVLYVKEDNVRQLPRILKRISRKQEETMRANGYHAFNRLCRGKNFINSIVFHYTGTLL